MVVSKEAQDVMVTDSSTSNYDSFDSGSSWSGSDGDDVETFSDAVVFRYCLDSTYDRSKFLRVAAPTFNKDDLVKLADQVSLYSGCSHHRLLNSWALHFFLKCFLIPCIIVINFYVLLTFQKPNINV
jgi:hypothetical protein